MGSALGHQFEEVARLGRGVDRRTHFACDVVLDGAHQHRGARGGIEQRFSKERRGRFAVGSGDADRFELALGMVEERCGGLRQRAPTVLDLKHRGACLIHKQMVVHGC